MKARNTLFKASAAVCAVLAGTLGFSSLASAGNWVQNAPYYQAPVEQRHGGRNHDGWNGEHRQQRFQQNRNWNHNQQVYRSAPRFHRGAYLPHEYRNRAYYVNDWRAYNGLYAPAYGQQWVNVDGEFLLVALATGLIANALIN